MLEYLSRTVLCATTSLPLSSITRYAYQAAEQGMEAISGAATLLRSCNLPLLASRIADQGMGVMSRAASVIQSYSIPRLASRVAGQGIDSIRTVTKLLNDYGVPRLAYRITGKAVRLFIDYHLFNSFRLISALGITIGIFFSESVQFTSEKMSEVFKSLKSLLCSAGFLGSLGFYSSTTLVAAYLLPYTIIAVICSRSMLWGAYLANRLTAIHILRNFS